MAWKSLTCHGYLLRHSRDDQTQLTRLNVIRITSDLARFPRMSIFLFTCTLNNCYNKPAANVLGICHSCNTGSTTITATSDGYIYNSSSLMRNQEAFNYWSGYPRQRLWSLTRCVLSFYSCSRDALEVSSKISARSIWCLRVLTTETQMITAKSKCNHDYSVALLESLFLVLCRSLDPFGRLITSRKIDILGHVRYA